MERLREHRRNRLAEEDVSCRVIIGGTSVIEAYQACLAGIVGGATQSPAFAVPCGEVVTAVAVELLCLSLDSSRLCRDRRQRLGRRVGVPLVEEAADTGRGLASRVATCWS